MVGRLPQSRGTATSRRKAIEKLLSDLANHQASTDREAFERKFGRRMTNAERDAIQQSPGQSPKTSA